MRLFIFLLISNFLLAGGIYHVESVKNSSGVEEGLKYYDSTGNIVKNIKYVKYDSEGRVVLGKLYDFVNEENLLIGNIEYFYNKEKVFLTIERDEKKEIRQVSWFFENKDEAMEEVRDSKNNVIKYYSHKDDTFEDVTRRVIEEKALEKLVVVEEKLIKTFKPLDSLKDILESNKNLVVAQTLRTIDMEYSDRMELLGTQLVVDGIKSYTHAEIVIMPSLAFEGKITIGGIKYEDIKKLIKEEKLYLLTAAGEKIASLLQKGAELPRVHREFLHTAGLTYEITRGNKVKNIKIEGRPLDPYRNYSIILPKYAVEGKGIFYDFTPEKNYELPYETSLISADYLRGIRMIDDDYRVEERRKKL